MLNQQLIRENGRRKRLWGWVLCGRSSVCDPAGTCRPGLRQGRPSKKLAVHSKGFPWTADKFSGKEKRLLSKTGRATYPARLPCSWLVFILPKSLVSRVCGLQNCSRPAALSLPGSQRLPHHDQLADVIGVVVGNEQGLTQQRLSGAVRNGREQVLLGISNQLAHRLQVVLN